MPHEAHRFVSGGSGWRLPARFAVVCSFLVNLARAGVRTDEYVFSQSGANKLARSLYVALRDRAIELPDDDEVRSELGSVRLVETGPGTVKMRNPPGTHDDVAVSVAMILADLAERPDVGRGYIGLPSRHPARVSRTLNPDGPHPMAPPLLAARTAAAKMPGGVSFIRGARGAYDDPRRG